MGSHAPSSKPSPSPSPTPTIRITDNKAVLVFPPGADPCKGGAEVDFQWTVSGAKQGDVLLAKFGGPATSADAFPLPLDANLMAKKSFAVAGSGVWTSEVVSIAGVPMTANNKNQTSLTCNS